MKKTNNRWFDNNNNSWNCDCYTETEAKKSSETLINCSNCSNCSNCYRCSDCYACSYCSNCSDCSRCSGCSDCSDCSRCSGCSDCSDCSDCSGCFRCLRCSNCSDCSRCSRCSYCSDCSGFEENPKRVASGLIGSRKATTRVYWTDKNDIQVVCGCYKGSLVEFEERVKSTYPKGRYHNEYMNFIKTAKHHIENEICIQEKNNSGIT
jgi:hypothetical protein